jgi:hypothetical protein
MITWFSARALRPARAALGLGAALGVGLGAGTARGQETPAPPAVFATSPVGTKVREKKELSEARLGAARAAAAAGKGAVARDLYGQALAVGLAATAQAAATAEPPRPTTVTSMANEEPDQEGSTTGPAPSPSEAEAEARRAAEETAAREQAEAAARAQAEAAAREQARLAQQRREEPAVAPLAVVAVAPAAPSGPPAVFEVGARITPAAKDTLGDDHLGVGLVFSWLTLATPYGRGSAVVDLESTRLAPGRSDTDAMDRAQVAFYGLGFDWTLPFASHGTGVFLGAEAAAGVLQTSTSATSAVGTDGVLQVMPHVGGAVAYRGLGLFADAGWRFQLLANSGKADMGGLVLQAGLRADMAAGDLRASGFDLGYTARFYSPNGSRVWSRYGGLFGADAGPLLGHELALTTSALLPPVLHMEQGLAFNYLGAGQDGGGTALTMLGLGYLATWHAFATRQRFNPYIGGRAGFVYISSDDPSTFQYKTQLSFTASAMAGVDVAVIQRVALRLGVAYDFVGNSNDKTNASLSGYAGEAGVVVRL